MKKILTILAATATMFAFGAVPESNPQPQVDTVDHGANFEAFTAGNAFSAGLNDRAQSENPYYWYTADTDAANIISNYTGSGTDVPIASRPDKFAEASNSKYLQVETTGKLYRTVRDNGGSPDFQSIDENNFGDYAFSLTNSAIYLDTLVKFTAADSVFGDDALETGDKIAIEYVEHESEGDGDPTVTNFVIRAGFKTSTGLIATNYYAYLPGDPTFANFDKDAWHRLTVRTIPDVGDGSVGFVVYVDETNLVYSTDVSAGYGANDLDGTASGFYNDNKHALFPSAVLTSKLEGKAISAAAFSGNGSLDDVVFTTSTPNFITAGESVVVTITKGTGITGVTVTVGGDTVAPVDASANPLVYNLAPGTTTFGLTADADSDNGYTVAGVSGERAEWGNDTVTITGPSPVLTVTATRNNVSYIDSEDQTQSTTSLAAAITGAKSGSTITLLYSIDVADVEGELFTTYTISGKNLTIDLNGSTIAWNDVDAETAFFTIASGSSLRVIDSSVANTGAIVYAGAEGCVFYNSGDCFIGATSGDYGPTVQGVLTSKNKEPTLIRGKFNKAANTASTNFKWADAIDEGSALAESLGDYWIVEPQGGSEPTQVAVPTALIGIMYDGTLKTGVVENVGYTLTGNTGTDAGEYEATATLAAGYIWSDSTTADKKIAWGILPNNSAEVVVTLASEIAEYTAQLEFPTATATIGDAAVAGNTAWDPATISEPEAGATNTYTVTFTVTTPNYAGSTGTATFKVYKAAGGGSNWPTGWNGGTEPASMVTAFNTWIAAGNDPTAANAEAAFLVGVDVDDYTSDFAATSIALADGKVVITGNYDLTKINGVLSVKMGNEPNALNTTTVINELTNGAISLTPAFGETKKFYQLVIGYPAN